MSKQVKVTVNQTLEDLAIIHLGGVEYTMDIAVANNLSITADLNTGDVITIPDVTTTTKQQRIVKYFETNNLNPASED